MIQVENVTKRYGPRVAIDDLSFSAKQGEILGFLGPNGAGKSTTMNIITGYLSSSSGRVRVNGADVLEEPAKAKRQIGYLPEIPPLYTDMKVKDYLKFSAGLKGMRRSARSGEAMRVMKLIQIDEVGGRLIKNLSKGYRQRVGFAQALVGDPPVLILDEPTIGLDPQQIKDFRSLLRGMGKNHTIVFSSHILSEVAAICDRVVIIREGRIVATGSPDSLAKGASEKQWISVRVVGTEAEALKAARSCQGVLAVRLEDPSESGAVDLVVETGRDGDLRGELSLTLARACLPVLMMKPLDFGLEEAFLSITGKRKKERS